MEVVLIDTPIPLHQKLDKIPADLLHRPVSLLELAVSPQELIERVSVLSVDLNLGEKLITGSVAHSEGFDLSVGSRLFLSELVARECEDLQPLQNVRKKRYVTLSLSLL